MLFEPGFIWKKFLSPCFEDFSNAVLTNDIPYVNFLTAAKKFVKVRDMENDLLTVRDTGKPTQYNHVDVTSISMFNRNP